MLGQAVGHSKIFKPPSVGHVGRGQGTVRGHLPRHDFPGDRHCRDLENSENLMLKITPQTPTESRLLEAYGLDCLIRYRAVLAKPERVKGRRKPSKPWFSESPNLTPGMKRTIRRQYESGKSVAGLSASWAIPAAVVRDVLGLPQISPRRR